MTLTFRTFDDPSDGESVGVDWILIRTKTSALSRGTGRPVDLTAWNCYEGRHVVDRTRHGSPKSSATSRASKAWARQMTSPFNSPSHRMPRPFKSEQVIEQRISEATFRAFHVGYD